MNSNATHQPAVKFQHQAICISIAEACFIMGISVRTGWNWINQKKFPVQTANIGGRRVCRHADVIEYLDNLFLNPSPLPDMETPIPSASPPTPPAATTKRGRGRPRVIS